MKPHYKTSAKFVIRCFALLTCIVATISFAPNQGRSATGGVPPKIGSEDYPVIELRRYTIKEGERQHFAQRYEAFFPEAIQQTGAIVAGEFFERANQSMFTWIRAFHDLNDRARLNGDLYFGPVWQEHKTQMNDLLVDSDNVLLLHPLDPTRGIAVFPAVDPAKETRGAQGVAVVQLFPVKPDSVQEFSKRAEVFFAEYLAAGAKEAGVLVTLDVKNNFPQLPIRTDGPYLAWVGILKDNSVFENQLKTLAEQAARSLTSTGLLRKEPELIVLDPAPRSRMRWLPDWP